MLRALDLGQLGWRIESVDALILTLLAHRMSLALNVGAYKLAIKAPIYRSDKEKDRLEKVRVLAQSLGLNPEFAHALLYFIIDESCKQQMIQLQGSYELPVDTDDEDEWYRLLKQNLLDLTKRIASLYDQKYDDEFFASNLYRMFERKVLLEEIGVLSHRALAIDLGCATGRQTFEMADHFDNVIGYDISPEMLSVAEEKKDKVTHEKVVFCQADLEDGISLPDESVSFAVMNLGTASDVRNIDYILAEVGRVLVPDGRFLFSFYNLDALVYQWSFLPWPVSLAAEINHEKRCLDVHVDHGIFSVYARAYSVEEVKTLFISNTKLKIERILSFPTVSPILPEMLFREDRAKIAISTLDETLANSGLGAYIIATGIKNG